MWGTLIFSVNSPEEYLEPSRVSTMSPIFGKKIYFGKESSTVDGWCQEWGVGLSWGKFELGSNILEWVI